MIYVIVIWVYFENSTTTLQSIFIKFYLINKDYNDK